ncbi:MAG: hypothetical protein NZ553_11035 [Caldilinea sp.]|nr:hypothetical protein [Caldilinea sp.]MDW8440998.1 hypothetical protein [Caldilineaceae bacterium]
MRRFSLQLLAGFLAWRAVHVVAGAEAFAPYLLRDAGLLAFLAAALFAWQGAGWQPMPALRRIVNLSGLGQVIWLTGLVCLVVGGLGVGVAPDVSLKLMATLVWLMGVVLSIIGVWWPGATYVYAPPISRWEQDARGRFVRVTPDGRKVPPSFDLQHSAWLGLLFVLLLGVALRVWNLGGLPSGCIDVECIDALRLVEGQTLTASTPGAFNLYERLAQLLLRFTGDGLLSLRLAATLFGVLGLLAFVGVTRRLAPPLAAVPVLLLLALNPWHLYAGRVADAWLAPMGFATLALWLTLQALAHADVRRWTLAGLALGLLFVEVEALRLAALLWSLAALGLAFLPDGSEHHRSLPVAVPVSAIVAMVGVAAPALLHRTGASPTTSTTADLWEQAVVLFGALLRPDAAPESAIGGGGLLPSVVIALVIVGAGALARNVRRPAALLVAAGAIVFSAAALRVDSSATPLRSLLLPVLPFWLAIGGIGLERMMDALTTAWGGLVRPARLSTATALALTLLLGVAATRMVVALNAAQRGDVASLPNEIARYIAGHIAGGDAQTTFVVPAGVFQHPGLRLLVGEAMNAGRVQMLDFGTTLPYAALPPGDVVYLTPGGQNQVLEQVLLTYPAAEVVNSAPEEAWLPAAQRTAFTQALVSRQTILDHQAFQLRLYRGAPTEAGGAEFETLVATTAFDWQARPPAPPPFTARLSASLSLAQMGAVEFAVEVGGSATASLLIDGQLVLDTQLGIREKSVHLAQGVHTLEIDYRSGDRPGDLALFWRPPGAARSPLPTSVLHAPPLPEAGLFGEYWAGDAPGGMVLTRRLDRILGFDFGLEPPYNVHWQGKLGVARAGEHLIAALANGPHQIWIDGRLVVDGQQADGTNPETAYHEGLIYLEQGWRDLAIRYRPVDGTPDFRLLWQPPGAGPGELAGAYLAPVTGERTLIDQAPPPALPLLDPRLGDDAFALLRLVSAAQPGVRIPPQQLEPLPLETLWSVGAGCGSGENQFNAPNGLAFAPTGAQLYVADTGNRRVQVLDLDGGFRPSIADAGFEEPVDVAFASDGSLLVLDAVGSPIVRLNADGALTPLPVQTSFYRPRGFDIAADGAIAVADTGGGRVVVLNQDGFSLAQYGGVDSPLARGQPVDALHTPRGLWAITAEDGRLWNLELDGGLTALQPTATIHGPKMAHLPNGGFLITDPARRTFTAFAATGRPLQQFGYVDQLLWPTGIAAFQAGEQLFIAASDARACTVTLWRMAVEQLR